MSTAAIPARSKAPAPPTRSSSSASTSPRRCMTAPPMCGATVIDPLGVHSSSPDCQMLTVPLWRYPGMRTTVPPRGCTIHLVGNRRGLIPGRSEARARRSSELQLHPARRELLRQVDEQPARVGVDGGSRPQLHGDVPVTAPLQPYECVVQHLGADPVEVTADADGAPGLVHSGGELGSLGTHLMGSETGSYRLCCAHRRGYVGFGR